MGWLLRGHFGGGLRWGRGPHPVRQVLLPFGPGQGSSGCWGSGGRSPWADSHSGRDTPRGMLNRVDVGALPSNRWYGVTIIPWPLVGAALRAVPQAVRKVRQSFPSFTMASASRHWMSLVWACWVERALEEPLDSASLMVVEQQFSASARAREQLSSISLRQAACWTLASLISTI